jgi:hypothetical protein
MLQGTPGRSCPVQQEQGDQTKNYDNSNFQRTISMIWINPEYGFNPVGNESSQKC